MFWKLAFDKLESIFKIKEDQKITRKIPKFTQIRRRLHKEKVPRISIEVAYKSKETGEITTVKDIERTPVAKFPPHLYTKLYEQATVEVKDILKIHNLKCPNSANRMQISSDGVSECKSNSVTLDVYSCKAVNCRVIYPIRIIRPLNKFKIDHRQNLEHVINDMLENLCLIAQYIADNLKRATAKECLNHASTFPCEYCFSSAERFYLEKTEDHTNRQIQIEILAEKIRKLKEIVPSTQAIKKEIKKLEEISKQLKRKNNKRSHLVMPASTRHGEYRTAEKMKIIYEKIDENPNLPASERKGVVRRSALLDIPNFDAQHDCPVEYMHATCIGVVKQMVELTFDVGENRPRITKRKLSTALSFNELMKYVKVPGEFPRRIRELDFSVMKAAEYRNVILFYFPIVIQCIPVDDKERLLWLYLAFMIRSCVLSTQEFSTKLIPDIDFCSEKFYLLYEKVYGPRNCTYNTHVVSSHLMDMRYHGPLTFTSAFLFESFYGEMRNAFVPGTPSPLKQIMQNVFLKRAVSKHSCKPNLIFCDHDTSLECNTLFYVYKHSAYHIYTIVKIQGEELITNEIETEECSFAEAPKRLKWGEIGVFCEGKMGTEFVVINANNVSGKVLRVGKYLLTCPDDVLTET